MGKMLNINQAIRIAKKLKRSGKSIVLVGGVFDILHVGHIKFLEKAKKEGDMLFVILESDKSVRKLKGPKRPINNQTERAQVLEALRFIDFIIKLQGVLKNDDYDKIVKQIGPNVLATTAGDSYIFHKKRQAKLIGGKLKVVIERLKHKSTSKILNDYE